MYRITFAEAPNKIILVLPHTFYQIRSHTNIKRTVSLIGKNVNSWILFHLTHSWIPDQISVGFEPGMTTYKYF